MAMKTSTSQRGATLIEALVALLVMSLSLLAATKLQSWLQLHADLARERSDAVRLAPYSEVKSATSTGNETGGVALWPSYRTRLWYFGTWRR